MKTKKIRKKLSLSKETIALLNHKNMATARGGDGDFSIDETMHCSCDCQGVFTVGCTIEYTGCAACVQTEVGTTCNNTCQLTCS
jgi:natural product precursor